MNEIVLNAGKTEVVETGKGEIVIYQPDEVTRLEVKVESDTVWLNRNQLAVLFGRDIKTIGKHINNALKEELRSVSTVAKFATVQKEGERWVERYIEYYNLDMIISIGYRVKSDQGVLFRQWANKILKEYMLRGYALNQYIRKFEDRVNLQLANQETRLNEYGQKIDFFVRTSLPPVEGVFFDGQIFDAYVFATDLIRSAVKSLILIDNYVDESVLLMLSKRQTGVSAEVRTGHLTATLKQDIVKHNSQYPPIVLTETKSIHDRFLIVDDDVYHIGASLKDLGKKLFAFSKMNISKDMMVYIRS